MEEPDDRPAPLARRGPWSGDDHALQVAAAREVGLPEGQVATDSFTAGFSAATQLRDPADGALVIRGRTVLTREQLDGSLRAVLEFLKIQRGGYRLRVHDGAFELRIEGRVAEATTPVIDAGRRVLTLWLLLGVVGFALLQLPFLGLLGQAAAGLVWTGALLYGALVLRRGMVSGRAMLGARLAVALGMFAQEEKLILPLSAGELAALPKAEAP